MNSNRNGWDSTKQIKMPYFHCGRSTKTPKHYRETEKNRKIYSKYKKYM